MEAARGGFHGHLLIARMCLIAVPDDSLRGLRSWRLYWMRMMMMVLLLLMVKVMLMMVRICAEQVLGGG